MEISAQNARWFRLHVHHLSKYHKKEQLAEVVGACGMQNTPPGAWETALFNRARDCPLPEMNDLLYTKKTLLQAWSFRGAPVVFPASESSAFLSTLIPEDGEEWIYTRGIALALDYLGMAFDELLDMLTQVITGLDHEVIVSKSTLDQTLAEWMLPLLPAEKRDLWNAPSMYGRPDIQTVGGAVVSFCSGPVHF